jgi:hypothetical protein
LKGTTLAEGQPALLRSVRRFRLRLATFCALRPFGWCAPTAINNSRFLIEHVFDSKHAPFSD